MTDQYPEISGDDAGIVPPQGGRGTEWPKKIRTLTAAELDRLTIDAAGRFYWDGRLVNYEPPVPPKPPVEEKRVDDSMDALDRSAMELLDRAALELSDRKTTDPDADPLAVTDPSAATDPMASTDPLAAADPSGVADPLTTEHGHTPGETGETKSPDLARAIDFDLSTSQPTPQRIRSAPAAAVAPEVDFDEQDAMAPAIRLRGDQVQVALTGGQSFALFLLIMALLIGASGVAVSGWVAMHEWGCRVGMMTRYCPADLPTPHSPGRSDIPA